MKGRGDRISQVKKWLVPLEKYKFVLLILLLGAALVLIPTKPEGEIADLTAPHSVSGFDLNQLEEKLATTLSQIQGAGEVSVVLTLQGGSRQVLATDSTKSQREDTAEEERQTVVIAQGSGQEAAVTLQEIYPIYQGALIVCPGGDDPTVAYQLTQAISALTGLGADKISICKAK